MNKCEWEQEKTVGKGKFPFCWENYFFQKTSTLPGVTVWLNTMFVKSI